MDEIGEQLQAVFMALLRMKLNGEDIVLLCGRIKPYAIITIRRARGSARIAAIIAMEKVKARVLLDIVPER